MGIFRSDPIADATAEITRLSKREEYLRGRLATARRAFDDAQASRRELLIADDADEESMIEGHAGDEVRLHADRCVAIEEALAELPRRRALAERKLADIQDSVRREQIAAGLAEVHTQIAKALTAHQESGRSLFDALRRVSVGEVPSLQLAQFDRMLASQIAEMLREIEGRRQALLSGAIQTATIAVNQPAIAPPAPVKEEAA